MFAAEGLATPIDEIARRAGLGVGTLYRHFPTKEALFAAIVLARTEEVIADARSRLEAEAPGEAFLGCLARLADGWSQKKDFIDALAGAGVDMKDLARAKHELHRLLAELLERAQQAGSLRTDVSIPEILALVAGLFGSLQRHGIAAKGRERMLAVVFDGLRPPRATKAPAFRKRRSAAR